MDAAGSRLNCVLGMMRLLDVFRIRREERLGTVVCFLMFCVLHAFHIYHNWEVFHKIYGGYFYPFIRNYHLSGYDPMTYMIVSRWSPLYDVYRHPLLAQMMYLPSQLNQWLMAHTDVNCALFIVAAILMVCVTYSYVFLYRIFRQVIGLGRREANMLSAFHFSLAYVMVGGIAPDHFAISMFLLIMVVYVSGKALRSQRQIPVWQTVALFFLTAGVTLSNGVKVFLASFMVNGRRFFRPVSLLTVILSSLMIWSFARWEEQTYITPRNEAAVKKKQSTEELIYRQFRDTTSMTDSVAIRKAAQEAYKVFMAKQLGKNAGNERKDQPRGEPIKKGKFWEWTDMTTPRWDTAVENLFGEAVLLHRDHLLGDTLLSRPVIVRYRWWINYAVEAVIVLFFLAGLLVGWRDRFLQLCLSFFAFDLLLHMVIGFGVNEVYIMSPHWLFVLPLSMGYLLLKYRHRWIRYALWTLVLYLFIYNGSLLTKYLLQL